MAYDIEEQEQLDDLKAWWKRWGNRVIGATAAVVIAASGYYAWRGYQVKQRHQALAVYETLLQGAAMGNVKAVRDTAGALIENFGSTPYATWAAFIAARVNYANGDPASARAQLTWAMGHAASDGAVALARLRLAGLDVDEGKYAAALALLDARLPAEFAGQAADLRGDVLVAQGKKKEARAEYLKARDAVEAGSPWRKVIELKLDALGEQA